MTQKKPPILAALVHEIAKRETFERYADLKEAIKLQCAALRIPYEAGTVAAALDLVERSRRLVVQR